MDYIEVLGLLATLIMYFMFYVGYRENKTMDKAKLKERTNKRYKPAFWFLLVILLLTPLFVLLDSGIRKQILSCQVIIFFAGSVLWLFQYLYKKIHVK